MRIWAKMIIIGAMTLTFPSLLMAKNLLYEMTYASDQQASGCVIRHALYDNSAERISMLWVVEQVCAGQVQETDQVVFSRNTMKAWPNLLNKANKWGEKALLGSQVQLHHWGDDIFVEAKKVKTILGETIVVLRVTNSAFQGDLKKPLQVNVVGKEWSDLADKIAKLAFYNMP
jgi:hypothetical protein